VSEHFTVDKMVGDTVDFYLSGLRERVPGLHEWARLSHERGGERAEEDDVALLGNRTPMREPVPE
jgi:hypothetical protein